LKTFTVADHYTKSDADTLLAAKSPLASPSFTGSVGIGTSSPLGNLSVEGNGRLVTIGDSGSTNVPEIKATNAAGTGEAFLKISAYEHRIGTNSTQRLTVQNNGHVKINTGNLIIGTSGQGIDFSAASGSAAGSSSAVLDDYEEGTWTVGLRGSSTAGNHTYHGRNGTYTKVGKVVHIQGGVHMNAINTMSGEIYVTGLPFTTGTSGSAFSFSYGGAMSFTAGTTPVGYSVANATEFLIRAFDATTGTSPLNQSEIGNGTQIIFSGTYFI
jgi:hypothetical protein